MEAVLLTQKHILICLNVKDTDEMTYIRTHFCGQVYDNYEDFNKLKLDINTRIYVCGDMGIFNENYKLPNKVFIIRDHSYNFDEIKYDQIETGFVPINIHNVGLFFRKYFNDDNYFDKITTEHNMQTLTEGNNITASYRKGIYITPVEETKEGLEFRLLRCSTNLDGPTDNFRETDYNISMELNKLSRLYFDNSYELNHVLAQVYENKTIDGKQKKAKIKDHSDKTKDMANNGIMVFCTFYKMKPEMITNKSEEDKYDLCYKKTSVYTTLYFKLKDEVKDEKYVKNFSIKLYPNSVFMMSLSTNRLYTHEIRPSSLSIEQIPTRLGYVVRCSNTKALYKNEQTYIMNKKELIKLEEMTEQDEIMLRELYKEENITIKKMEYGIINFSMNKGDYMKPNI